MKSFFAKRLVGVDVGSRTVKAVCLKSRKGSLALDRFFFYDLAQSGIAYPQGANAAEALRAGVEIQGLENSQFAASLPDRQMIRLDLKLPRLPEAELPLAVKHEMSEMTGIELNDLAFDYFVLPSTGEASNEISVCAYGTNRGHVDGLVKLVSGAKLKAARVESDTLAIVAALTFNDYIAPDQAYAIFDMGESHLTAALVTGGELRVSKSFERGWGSINTALGEKFRLDYAAAEDRKKRYDFSSSHPGEQDLEQAIDEAYAGIFSDIKTSLALFADFEGGTQVNQILLTGGPSQTLNFPRVLEMFFKIPAVAANPFRNIELYGEDQSDAAAAEAAPYLMTATGLALSAFPGKKAA